MGSIRHTEDRRGRKIYYIDYYAQGIRRREHVGYSKKEAENALQSRLTDIRRRKFDHILPESRYTLKQIESQYLRHSKTTKSPPTYERDQSILECHLIPKELDDGASVGSWLENLLDSSSLEGRNVLVGDDPSSEDQDVLRSFAGQQLQDPGKEMHVCTRENRDSDGIYVLLDRSLDDLLRRLSQT